MLGATGVTETEEPLEFVLNVRDDNVSIGTYFVETTLRDVPESRPTCVPINLVIPNTVRENGPEDTNLFDDQFWSDVRIPENKSIENFNVDNSFDELGDL